MDQPTPCSVPNSCDEDGEMCTRHEKELEETLKPLGPLKLISEEDNDGPEA